MDAMHVTLLPADPAQACLTPEELAPYLPSNCVLEQHLEPWYDALLWLPNLAAGNMAAGLEELLTTLYGSPGSINLRMVHLPMTGVEVYSSLFWSFLRSDGSPLIWCCTKGAYAEPVAEHALSLILTLYRGLHISAPTQTRSLCDGETTVYLIGNGSISRALQNLLAPFKCGTIVSNSSTPRAEFEESLARADVVVVCCPLTAQTRGMIDGPALRLMKPTAILINVARGEIVDTGALLIALNNGRIAAAGLDVWTPPEDVKGMATLQKEGKLLITPHSALPIASMKRLLLERLRHNLESLRVNKPATLLGVIDAEKGY